MYEFLSSKKHPKGHFFSNKKGFRVRIKIMSQLQVHTAYECAETGASLHTPNISWSLLFGSPTKEPQNTLEPCDGWNSLAVQTLSPTHNLGLKSDIMCACGFEGKCWVILWRVRRDTDLPGLGFCVGGLYDMGYSTQRDVYGAALFWNAQREPCVFVCSFIWRFP